MQASIAAHVRVASNAFPQWPTVLVLVLTTMIVMFVPQIFFYGVIGTATAVMNSRRRFALAAGAPAVESLGTMAVLGAATLLYGTRTSLDVVSSKPASSWRRRLSTRDLAR